VPLDDAGVAQAERAARLLASLRPDAIVASDLRRAADTAAPLAGLTGLPVRPDARLRERHGGEWQGLTGEQLAARFPTEYGAWRRGEPVVPVGGEGYATVADRATAALAAALAPLPDDGTLVVVTHGGTARAAIGRLLGLPERAWSALGPLANCAWSALGQQGSGWRLLEHNAGTLPEAVLSDDS
jgi:broad specificity phosphatase PhoE